MSNLNWDDYFMNMVYLVAMKSKDENTHIGAVIVGPDKEIRSTGYNSFVRGINDSIPERQIRPEKYFWFEHAERNAIYNAARIGVSTKDCTMYTNGVPCMDCARAVIQAGIKRVVVDKQWDDNNVDIWLEQAKRSLQMFTESGVEVRYINFNLIELHKFRKGEKL
jgi:dCMP deaminase